MTPTSGIEFQIFEQETMLKRNFDRYLYINEDVEIDNRVVLAPSSKVAGLRSKLKYVLWTKKPANLVPKSEKKNTTLEAVVPNSKLIYRWSSATSPMVSESLRKEAIHSDLYISEAIESQIFLTW